MQSLRQIAERQWRDYQAHRPGTYFGEAHAPLDLADAYAIQHAVCQLRVGAGDDVAGYKIGCTGPAIKAQFGMEGPVRGYLYRSELYNSGVTIDPRRYQNLAIEGEIGLGFDGDGALAAAFPVIELHNYVFRALPKTLTELVANNALNAGLVLPPGAWQSSARYLTAPGKMTVRINGEKVGEGGLWPHAGGPEVSLAWLRRHLAEYGLALAPGDLVIAGTPLGLYPVKPEDRITVCLDDMPITECRIATM